MLGARLAAVGLTITLGSLLGGCLSTGGGTTTGSLGGVTAPPPAVTREAPNGRRVSVATYNVGYSRETVRGAQSRGLMARGTASAQTKTKLEGVPPEVFQRIADAGYQDLVTRLRAAGFEVVPAAQSQTYARLSSGQNPRFAHDAANSRGVISFNTQQMQVNSASELKAVSTLGDPGATGFGGLDYNSAGRIVAELDAERVLAVRHVVDYVSQTSSNDMPLGSLAGRASVTTEQGMSLRAGQMANYFEKPRVGIGTNNAIQFKGMSSPEAFAGNENATSSGQATANGLSAAGAILTGGLTGLASGNTRAIVANPQAYERIAVAMISTANAQIVQELKATR
jgi:hypothetical protein